MPTDLPLVSIITPVFNDRQFLSETRRGVLKQGHQSWEWILVDDGSTDGSDKMIESWVAADSRIKLRRTPENSGAATARNVGIAASQGQYLAFLDADDVWNPEKLGRQLAFMHARDAYFSYTGFTYVDEEGVPTGATARPPSLMNYGRALKNTTILTSTVMLDKKRLPQERISFPDVRRGQDTALWWRLLRTTGEAHGIPDPLTLYRQRRGSLSANRLKALRRTWRLYRDQEDISVTRSCWHFSHYVVNAVTRRRPTRARR